MLRKKDVIDAVGVAKSTISDWLTEFQIFIPTIKQGSVVYYLPETIDVLLAIKELRSLNYTKPEIMNMLRDRGFPITVKEAIEDAEKVIQKADYRDGFLAIMHSMSETVARIGEQAEQLNQHEHKIERHRERLDGQDGRIEELIQMVQYLQNEVAVTKEQLVKQSSKKWFQFWR